jgi:hypothetical protein
MAACTAQVAHGRAAPVSIHASPTIGLLLVVSFFSNGWLLRSDPWADGSALRRCVLRPFARRQRSSTPAGGAIIAGGASGGAAGAAGGGRAALRMHGLLSRFMWRHARSHVEDQIALPPCFERTVRIEFSAAERANYHQRQSELAVQVHSAAPCPLCGCCAAVPVHRF